MIINLLNFKKKISENLKKKKFKKIYILTGKNSFYAAGINKELSSIIKKVKFRIYFKKRNFPEVLELKKIISELNKFKPDLIITDTLMVILLSIPIIILFVLEKLGKI